jgi:hypothetical protein
MTDVSADNYRLPMTTNAPAQLPQLPALTTAAHVRTRQADCYITHAVGI